MTTNTGADRVGKIFVVSHALRRCLICDGLFTQSEAAYHAEIVCYPRRQVPRLGGRMQIGEPLRTIIVEPLELPVGEPENQPEPIAPEPEQVPAKR